MARVAPVRFAPVRFAPVRFAPVRFARARLTPAVLADPAPNYGDRSPVHRGALSALASWRRVLRWPWLVGVFADERGQDFQNCGVAPGRIVGDALWRVDAA